MGANSRVILRHYALGHANSSVDELACYHQSGIVLVTPLRKITECADFIQQIIVLQPIQDVTKGIGVVLNTFFYF